MKYKVQLTTQLGMGFQVIEVEADEFVDSNGLLSFYTISEIERTVHSDNQFSGGIHFPQRQYPYTYKEKIKDRVALFAPGVWAFVTKETK